MSAEHRDAFWAKEDALGLRCVVRGRKVDVDALYATAMSLPFILGFIAALFIPVPNIRAIAVTFICLMGVIALVLVWKRARIWSETAITMDGRGLLVEGERISAGRIQRAWARERGWRTAELVLELIGPQETRVFLANEHSMAQLFWLVEQINSAAGAGDKSVRDAMAAQAHRLSQRSEAGSPRRGPEAHDS